jgi:hypothetical protein
MMRLLQASAVLLLAGGVLGIAPVTATAVDTGTIYYVDAASGNDSAAGTTSATAWRTLDKVDASRFGPGDRILLHAGQKWTGQLWPKGSGADGQPIVIDAYGSGAKPEIDGGGQVADAVRLHNQQYWDIRNLQVTNAKPLGGGQPGTNLRDLRGIGISGDTGGQLSHFHIPGDGILLCQCGRSFGNVRVRYNVIASNSRYQIYLHSNRGTTASVYNNTVYNDRSNYLIYGYGSNLAAAYHLWNNVLYSTRSGASLTTSPTIDYTANLYGGASLPVPSSDRRRVVGNPRFLGRITGPYGNADSGPAVSSVAAQRGTFATAEMTVPPGNGFNGGKV